jgi:hypothetical protein
MKQKYIIFFSSDASDLYKADIFRVLALPDSYTIQFRYQRQYVLEEFRENPAQLKNRRAAIFFLAGNDLSKPSAERVIRRYPVRSCTVIDAFLDENTDQIILILQLGDFVNCVVDPVTDQDKLPPIAFVSEADLDDFRPSKWIDRVRAVEGDFPETLFYRIAKIVHENTEVVPSYSAERRLSFFKLQEESDYSIECSCYDPKGGGRSPLQIAFKSEEIDLDNSFESGPRARLDTRRLPLTTRALKSRSAPASFVFCSPKKDVSGEALEDPNDVRISWLLQRKVSKPWLFGAFTLAAALGLAMSQIPVKSEPSGWIPGCALCIKLLGLLLISVAGGLLFNFFNKT